MGTDAGSARRLKVQMGFDHDVWGTAEVSEGKITYEGPHADKVKELVSHYLTGNTSPEHALEEVLHHVHGRCWSQEVK